MHAKEVEEDLEALLQKILNKYRTNVKALLQQLLNKYSTNIKLFFTNFKALLQQMFTFLGSMQVYLDRLLDDLYLPF